MPEEWRTPPYEWAGSKPEFAVFWALTQLGLKPDEDFVYQSPQGGGRMEYGGAVLDFLLFDLGLAINVQSIYYHSGVDSVIHDQLVSSMVASWGIQVIYIDEEDALSNPIYYVKEAMAGRDHSRLGK